MSSSFFVFFHALSSDAAEQEQSDSSTVGGTDSGEEEIPERPTFVYPSREELLRDFPNAPEAPTRPPLDMKDFRQEDLISGNMDITYGGKVCASYSSVYHAFSVVSVLCDPCYDRGGDVSFDEEMCSYSRQTT